ncbi:hypothetical protein Dimus_006158 [Dionaea muscipula]
MDFCPTCGNLLQYDTARLFCRACPYVYPITNKTKIRRAVRLPKKEEAPNKERKVTEQENKVPPIEGQGKVDLEATKGKKIVRT